MSDHIEPASAAADAAASIPPRRLVSQITDGGHEVDQPNSQTLMAMLVAMIVVVVISAIGVYQLFIGTAGGFMDEAAKAKAADRVAVDAHDKEVLTTFGSLTLGDQTVYRVPIAQTRAALLKDPKLLGAAAPPAGWVHPDDSKK